MVFVEKIRFTLYFNKLRIQPSIRIRTYHTVLIFIERMCVWEIWLGSRQKSGSEPASDPAYNRIRPHTSHRCVLWVTWLGSRLKSGPGPTSDPPHNRIRFANICFFDKLAWIQTQIWIQNNGTTFNLKNFEQFYRKYLRFTLIFNDCHEFDTNPSYTRKTWRNLQVQNMQIPRNKLTVWGADPDYTFQQFEVC